MIEEITIELFLQQLSESCKIKLSKARELNNADKIPPLVLSLSLLTQLGQMLFIIRANNELELVKDVGDIRKTFGHMMQRLILETIDTYILECVPGVCEVIPSVATRMKDAQIIYKQVIDLTGVDAWPTFENKKSYPSSSI